MLAARHGHGKAEESKDNGDCEEGKKTKNDGGESAVVRFCSVLRRNEHASGAGSAGYVLVQYTETFACCPWINVPASLKLSIHILLAPMAEVGSCLGFLFVAPFEPYQTCVSFCLLTPKPPTSYQLLKLILP